MLSDFELQFQTTLRSKIAAGVRPRVQIATGAVNQNGVLIGVKEAQPVPDEFSSRRFESTPGASSPRRVMRLRCNLECQFVPDNNEDRPDLMQLYDQVCYALDDEDIRNGQAFEGGAPDPGFLISATHLEALNMPFEINPDNRLTISLAAEGWFWPIGQAGQSGVEIGEIVLRGVVHPVVLTPAQPRSVANGPDVDLSIVLDARGSTRMTANLLQSEEFGNIRARLENVDGTQGDGELSGGLSGSESAQVLRVEDGKTGLRYSPPASPGEDILILTFGENSGVDRVEIGRFTIKTDSPA